MKIFAKALFLYLGAFALHAQAGETTSEEQKRVSSYAAAGFDLAVYSKNSFDGKPAGSFVGISGIAGADAMAVLYYGWKIRALAGQSMLTRGNNIDIRLTGFISPVHFDAKAAIAFTPIAFLTLYGDAAAGSGWSITSLATGLGLNEADGINKEPFQGALLQTSAGAKIQFDLGAVVPGRWTHLAFQADANFAFRHFTAASGNHRPWKYMNDSGKNLNGWRWRSTYALVYMMPLKLAAVGLFCETEQNLGQAALSSPMGSGWGSDFMVIKAGPIFNFQFTEADSLILLTQFRREIIWHENSQKEKDLLARTYKGPYWSFYRIALSYRHLL